MTTRLEQACLQAEKVTGIIAQSIYNFRKTLERKISEELSIPDVRIDINLETTITSETDGLNTRANTKGRVLFVNSNNVHIIKNLKQH